MRSYLKSFFRHLRGDGHRAGIVAARVDAICWIGLIITLTLTLWS